MAYLIGAYPEIAIHDYDEIQAIRWVDHILYFWVVKSHFTIVLRVFDWDNAPARAESSCQLAREIRAGI